MSKTLMAALVFACFALDAPEAAAKNNPSVTGGFTSRVESFGLVRIRKVNLSVVQHKDGSLTGGITTTETTFVNGVQTGETTVKGDAEELIIVGNRAYVRVGTFYFVVVDNGQGANADPDRSFGIVLQGGLPLAAWVNTLNQFVNFVGAETITGNAQVRS